MSKIFVGQTYLRIRLTAGIAVAKVYIDNAKLYKTGLVFYAHDMNSASTLTLVDYAIAQGIDVVTISELYNRINI